MSNFIFATHERVPAKELFEALKKEHIFVRYFSKERISNYLRISIGTKEEMEELIRFLKTQYPGILTERYEVEETQKETELLCGIAENRKCITKGGELDYSKAAALLIDEFRSGKLGKVTLEWPKEQENG